MTTPIKVQRRQVETLVKATFPEYRGRKFKVVAAEKVGLYDLNWSGGTRNQYRACTVTGHSTGGSDRYNAMAPWNNPAEGAMLPVPIGCVVVRHGMFCGKDLGLTVYVNPADMPRLLAA